MRGHIGQEILDKIQMNCTAVRWVHPQKVAANGVDGENGSDVLVDKYFPVATVPCWPRVLRVSRCVGVFPQRSQSSLTMPTGEYDQQRFEPVRSCDLHKAGGLN